MTATRQPIAMIRRTVLAGCAALCIYFAWTCEAGEPDPIPRKLVADLGSYAFGSYSEVKLEDGVITYKGRDSKPMQITPTLEQWRAFRKELDTLAVWKWRSDYFDPNVFDGSQWRLEIEYADKSLKTAGSNLWPDKDGVPRPSAEERKRWIEEVSNRKPRTVETGPTDVFQRYVAALERLLGGKPMQ